MIIETMNLLNDARLVLESSEDAALSHLRVMAWWRRM
jgi:hypothetical protein